MNGKLLAIGMAVCVASAARAEPASARPAARREAVAADWMHQDYMAVELPAELERQKRQWRQKHLTRPESRLDPPVLKELACFVADRGALVEERMIRRVLDELPGAGGGALGGELDALKRSGAAGVDGRWKALYLRACELRRARRLRPLLARWRRFVFSQHRHVPGTWKYTEGLSDAQSYRFFRPGSSLAVLEMNGAYGTVRTLLEDRGGILRNPDVSYDGRRLLLAWKKSDRGDDYHLYEMELATGKIRQLTSGRGFADYEGVYLPDGNICFSSTRCVQTVDCNWTEVSNLYLMDADGGQMRRIGFDQVHTIFPTVADDGRVLYTRWDYNDRAQIYTQPLFRMNPDGTDQREVYGATSWFPTNIVHARRIAGTDKLLAVITGHHTPAHGKLAVIDPARGRQEGRGIEMIAPVRETRAVRVDRYGQTGVQFQYPYPLDEDRFLVTMALPTPAGKLGRFNIYFMDRQGRRELLVEGKEAGEGIGCRQHVPLAPRPRPNVPPTRVDYAKTTGTFYVQDIYVGEGLRGVRRGTIKRLRVVALRYRASGIGQTRQRGAGGSSNVSTPIAIGNGSWDVKVVLGSAKVHEDGSVFFTAPARMPVYFQAIDANGCAVQTMRSWATLMPGESQSCVGCHEDATSPPPASEAVSAAAKAGPQTLEPFHGPARGFSFPKEVQPILDRHCIRCHDGRKDKPFSLSGETVLMKGMRRRLSRSYLALTHTRGSNGDHTHPVVNWIDSMSGPGMLPPYHRGAARSKLIAQLRAGHNKVKLSAEELEKLACWIDLLVPYCGDYLEANAWSKKDRDRWDHFAAKRARMERQEQAVLRALARRSPEEAGSGPPDADNRTETHP